VSVCFQVGQVKIKHNKEPSASVAAMLASQDSKVTPLQTDDRALHTAQLHHKLSLSSHVEHFQYRK